MLAREMARLLICETPSAGPDACGACKPCRTLDSAGHPDVLTVDVAAGKTRIAVGQIRELRAALDYPPHGRSGRAVVFEKAELMTEEAQNALLKTLEEPTGRTHLFLTTSSPASLLATIASRCSRLDLSPLPEEALEAIVARERPNLDAVSIGVAARLSSGSVTAALRLADAGLEELTAGLAAIDEALAAGDVARLLGVAEALAKDKSKLLVTLDLVALWYRDVMARAARGDDAQVAFAHDADRLAARAAALGVRGASARIAAALETAEALVRRNANARLATEAMFLRMLS
jgi:DNA polymerase-3 subunit delta'